MDYPWTLNTMDMINKMTPGITGKAFDPDWFCLRARFEQMERAFNESNLLIATLRRNQPGVKGS
jgi:hypothetical protein